MINKRKICSASYVSRAAQETTIVGILVAVFTFSIVDSNLVEKNVVEHSITAVAGDPAFLPCDISTQHSGDQVLLVLWYREDLGTPIYTVDGRNRDFNIAERWSDQNVFSNRAYFMPDKNPAELGIDHIRETDQAVYRCRVDFKIAQTKNTKVNLTVIVPPQKIVITNEAGNILSSVVGPYQDGASFTLRCDVFGAKPVPVVTWYRNDEIVKNKSIVLPNSGSATHVRSELRIEKLRREDLHSELTCQASNNAKTNPLAATLHVDMNFAPLNVKILGSNQPLSANRRYEIVCQSSGSRPPATIIWWKNNQRQENTKDLTSSNGNTTTSTLSFSPKKEDDGKVLSCRAENKMMSSAVLEDIWKLEIRYTPEARIVLGSSLNQKFINEGTDVYFDCYIDARPPVYKVEWKHNNMQLNINVNAGIITSNHSLVLQSVTRNTAGNYSCVGFNTEGEGESKPFHLNVLYAPTCKQNQTQIYGVAKQERADVKCHIDANPSEVDFRWSFNNSAETVDVSNTYISKRGTVSVVSYTPQTELDYGTLLCYASNSIGVQKIPCVFHIIAAGRPDQVQNCTIVNISTSTFSIRCMEGFNGGLTQYFNLKVKSRQTQELLLNSTSPVARFFVKNLKAGHHYEATITAFNNKGQSEPVILQTSTLSPPEKQQRGEIDNHLPGFRFTPLMSIIIGITSALFIVGFVVILVFRLHSVQNNNMKKRRHMNIGADGFSLDQSLSTNGSITTNKSIYLSKNDSISNEFDSDPDIIPQSVDVNEKFGYLTDYMQINPNDACINTAVFGKTGPQEFSSSGILKNNGVSLYNITTQNDRLAMTPCTACTVPRHSVRHIISSSPPVTVINTGLIPNPQPNIFAAVELPENLSSICNKNHESTV